MKGAPLRSVPTGTDVSAAGTTDSLTDSPPGADVGTAADTRDIDLEPALGAAVGITAVLAASLIDFLR